MTWLIRGMCFLTGGQAVQCVYRPDVGSACRTGLAVALLAVAVVDARPEGDT